MALEYPELTQFAFVVTMKRKNKRNKSQTRVRLRLRYVYFVIFSFLRELLFYLEQGSGLLRNVCIFIQMFMKK